MDENKAQRLRDIGYEMREACYSCEHSIFRDGSAFGLCLRNTYEHGKHTDSSRHLSVVLTGWCDQYEEAELFRELTSHFRF